MRYEGGPGFDSRQLHQPVLSELRTAQPFFLGNEPGMGGAAFSGHTGAAATRGHFLSTAAGRDDEEWRVAVYLRHATTDMLSSVSATRNFLLDPSSERQRGDGQPRSTAGLTRAGVFTAS